MHCCSIRAVVVLIMQIRKQCVQSKPVKHSIKTVNRFYSVAKSLQMYNYMHVRSYISIMITEQTVCTAGMLMQKK